MATPPTTVQTGILYLIKSGGTTIGGGRDATLTQGQELIDVSNKDSSNWKEHIPGIRSWDVSFTNMYEEGAAEVKACDMSFTVGGTALKGVKSVEWSVSTNMLESISTTTSCAREIVPTVRTLTCTVTGEWYDYDLTTTGTAGDEALEDVADAIDGTSTSTLACVWNFGSSQSFPFTARPTSLEITAPIDEIMGYSVTFEATGAPGAQTTTGADAGFLLLLADILDATEVQPWTFLMTTGTAGATEWTGTAYPETLTISADVEGLVQITADCRGSGDLTKQVTT